jgi:hypothetical protein
VFYDACSSFSPNFVTLQKEAITKKVTSGVFNRITNHFQNDETLHFAISYFFIHTDI